MNLHNARIFCLPDNYEVLDSSLDDIKRALFPSFPPSAIARLDSNTTLVRDVHGVSYLPGFIGLNNLKNTDYVNVILQALAHVLPLRDFFLQPSLYQDGVSSSSGAGATAGAAAGGGGGGGTKPPSQLVVRFGEVVRKLWSKDNFKSTVSPHDFLQEVVGASGKRYRIGKQGEAAEFLSWLLHQLHVGLGGREGGKKGGKKGGGSSVVWECFQGEIKVMTQTKVKKALTLGGGEGGREDEEDDGTGRNVREGGREEGGGEEGEWMESVVKAPFLFLTVDIPQTPLFKDSQGGVIIPQVPLYTVLEKFNGRKVVDVVKGGVHTRKKYWITRLPRYLILSLARLTRNHFFVEKNPTIVNFPVKNLEMKDYFFPEEGGREGGLGGGLPTEEDLGGMSVGELKAFVLAHGGGGVGGLVRGVVEKEELVEIARRVLAEVGGTKYDLVANVVHDSPPGQEKEATSRGEDSGAPQGTYRVHVFNRASDQWYEIQDLHVQETLPQLITISESCVLIYEKKGVVQNWRATREAASAVAAAMAGGKEG